MADWHSDDSGASGSNSTVVVERRPAWRRWAAIAGLVVVGLLIAAIVAAWLARRPIASGYLQREFERRGVTATYHLDRVGLRTQQVSNLVIGDPRRPDLVAKLAQIQMRISWNGKIEVYRIVARGVRLRGQMIHGKVHWGQIDKFLGPPSNKPFQLPNIVLDVADSTISLGTPFGPLGFALHGAGNLAGGFKGHLAVASPKLVPGKCQAEQVRANVAIDVVARRPHVVGPLTLARLTCPKSRFEIAQPRFDIDSRFNESFSNFDGRGRMAISTLSAGDNGLAAFVGNLTFNGTPTLARGSVELAAQRSRLGAILADRTRLAGRYRLEVARGTFVMVGDYAAQSAQLGPQLVAGVTGPLAAVAKSPIGPIAGAIGSAISRTVRDFDASGSLRMVNFPGGGAVRVDSANVRSPGGARVQVAGGDGVTYYWPGGRIRIDSDLRMAGGGLPNGRVALHQPRNGSISGLAEFAPYSANGSRLALAPVRFAAAPDGSTAVNTVAVLDGPFPSGQVRGLRLPINGHLGRGGGLVFGTACEMLQFSQLQTGSLVIGPTRLPLCPIGGALLSKAPNGPLRYGARVNAPVLDGRIGSSPLHATAANGMIQGQQFAFQSVAARLGQSTSPILIDAARLNGSFAGGALGGAIAGGKATIGKVPLLMTDLAGKWRLKGGAVGVDGGLLLSDRSANPRFYPLHSDNVHFLLAGGAIRATGTLRQPTTGTVVTQVSINHSLASGQGHAVLDVPGITFGRGLQPEQLTRLTEGVIALVNGTLTGQGRINWNGTQVTSTGDFSTARMDLAAPFGPVTGLKGTIHFNDLLGLTTAPGQVATIESINPGILVENGAIHYQLLPGQMVRVERGDWPFMGGRLILQETTLNFGRPSAKRLTFQVVGLNAKTFVDTLGFKEIAATGTFDGVLPMIFDENGGRIVGGRLDARPGGGTLSYVGVLDRANMGLMAKVAFDALKELRFKSMIVRLDGDLAGEFATRLTIEQFGLAESRTAKLLRAFAKVPFKFNVSIKGPFRALIGTAKSLRDPRQQVNDVLPRSLDSVSGIVTEVRSGSQQKSQTQTPVGQTVTITPTPPPARKK